MTRDELLAKVTDLAKADQRVAALLLTGSLGRGDGDFWSDLDLLLVIEAEFHTAFVASARDWVRSVAALVYWSQPFAGAPLFNAITEERLRCDLTITVPARVATSQDRCRPLIDRADVWKTLPAVLPRREADPQRVTGLVMEFIRVLGMAPIALGRKEYVVAVTGVGLQRTALIDLLILELGLPQPPGALHLSRLLTPGDMNMLAAIPALEADRRSVLNAQRSIAAAFIPRARQFFESLGQPWPEEFWRSTQDYLKRELAEDWLPLE